MDSLHLEFQGNGLLNIEGVFEHMVHNHNQVDRCKVSRHLWRRQCQGNSFEREGASKCQEISIQVELLFLDTENRPAKDKQDFNIQFVLSCSAGWVSHPTHLDLMYTNRHFLVSVDPTGLAPGAHCAYITAHDATNPARGKLFEVPINVIRTEKLDMIPRPKVEHRETFQPGTIRRHFLEVPSGATWATFSAANMTKDMPGGSYCRVGAIYIMCSQESSCCTQSSCCPSWWSGLWSIIRCSAWRRTESGSILSLSMRPTPSLFLSNWVF